SNTAKGPPKRVQQAAEDGNRSARIAQMPAVAQFYPEEARNNNISGKVILRVTIAADHCLEHAAVVRSSGVPALDDAALDLSEQAKYLAAQKAGQPIEDSFRFVVDFKLADATSTAAEPAQASRTTGGPLQRGNGLLDRGDYDGAMAEYARAIAQDPLSATALADRGMAYMWKRESKRARQDFD